MRTHSLPIPLTRFCCEEQEGKWKYVLVNDFSVRYPGLIFGEHEFADDSGRVWATSDFDVWTTKARYAWDGSSCVPDNDASLAASSHHDSQGQFRHLLCLSIALSGRRWNENYRDLIIALGSPSRAEVYYFGLTLFNPFYSAIGKLLGSKPTGQCLCHPKPNHETSNPIKS